MYFKINMILWSTRRKKRRGKPSSSLPDIGINMFKRHTPKEEKLMAKADQLGERPLLTVREDDVLLNSTL
jgi:hypothetical protein